MPTEYYISFNVDLVIYLYNRSNPPPSPDKASLADSSAPSDVVKYYVTAWSLQQASPIFSRIIAPDPRFKQPSKIECFGKDCTLITLEDDDHKALAIVLNLLHFNSKSLPSTEEISWSTFYDVAVIWDKYNISNLIRPPWVRHFQGSMNVVGYEDWLFIGKTFQENDGYVDLTARLIVEIEQKFGSNRAVPSESEGMPEFYRGGRHIKVDDWPDSIREHITSEHNHLMQRLQGILTAWKKSFKGNRPRAICICYGNVPRYNRHTALSNSITDLFSNNFVEVHPNNTMTTSPPHLLSTGEAASLEFGPAPRLRNAEGLGQLQWKSSIAALRRRMSVLRSCMGDRDLRQVKHMLDNADIYDLCPLEESSLRVLYDLDQTIEVIRGIGIDGTIHHVPLSRLIEDKKNDPWNSPGDGKRWDSLAMLGIRISGIFAVVSVLVFAIALGNGWGSKLVESGTVV